MANANCMKFKLSPFIVLFLSLNSILIFCATRKVEPEEKPSTGLTHTSEDDQLSPDDNFESSRKISSMENTTLLEHEDQYYIGYMTHEKDQNELNSVKETSAKTNLDEQKKQRPLAAFGGQHITRQSRNPTVESFKLNAFLNRRS